MSTEERVSPPAQLEQLEQLLARWVMGEAEAFDTLARLCATIEAPQVSCAIVREPGTEPALFGTAESLVHAALLLGVAERSAQQRTLLTAHDGRWSDLLSLAPLLAEVEWIAHEPVADGSGLAHAGVVVIGWREASPEDVLPALPRLARAVAVVLARERAENRAADVHHSLNNLVSAIVVNTDYAAELLSDRLTPPPPPSPLGYVDRRDLRQAIEHAREAAHQMMRQVAELARLRREGGG